MILKNTKNVAKYLSYLCGKICLQDLLKSAQSGHTVDNLIARQTGRVTKNSFQISFEIKFIFFLSFCNGQNKAIFYSFVRTLQMSLTCSRGSFYCFDNSLFEPAGINCRLICNSLSNSHCYFFLQYFLYLSLPLNMPMKVKLCLLTQ